MHYTCTTYTHKTSLQCSTMTLQYNSTNPAATRHVYNLAEKPQHKRPQYNLPPHATRGSSLAVHHMQPT